MGFGSMFDDEESPYVGAQLTEAHLKCINLDMDAKLLDLNLDKKA